MTRTQTSYHRIRTLSTCIRVTCTTRARRPASRTQVTSSDGDGVAVGLLPLPSIYTPYMHARRLASCMQVTSHSGDDVDADLLLVERRLLANAGGDPEVRACARACVCVCVCVCVCRCVCTQCCPGHMARGARPLCSAAPPAVWLEAVWQKAASARPHSARASWCAAKLAVREWCLNHVWRDGDRLICQHDLSHVFPALPPTG